MKYSDIIGTIGVGLILLAYFLDMLGKLKYHRRIFFGLNIAGSGLACYASWLIAYWPFVALEGTWLVVSVFGYVSVKNQGL